MYLMVDYLPLAAVIYFLIAMPFFAVSLSLSSSPGGYSPTSNENFQ